MSFLTPFALAFAAAAIVPLLLHLRRRRVARTVEFPAARYLARATRDHERTLRARSSLLAILRILLILLLALAAARPLARFGAGHGRAAIAILVDNSLSTAAVVEGRSVLDDEKDVARSIIAGASPDDRLWVVTADGVATPGNAAALRTVLDELRPLAGAGDLAAALRAATTVAGSARDATPAVVVLTDGQATTWRALRAEAAVVWTPTRPPLPNRALVAVEARPARWSGRGSIHVTARVGTAADSVAVRVEVDGRTVARTVAVPDGRGSAEADIAVSAPRPGWSAVRVVLPPDELPADDERWLAIWNGSAPQVVSRGGIFADRAVDALVAAGVVQRGPSVTIVSADALDSLPALIAAPGDPSRLGAANRALERAGVPWRLGAERRDVARASSFPDVDVRQRYALTPVGAAPVDTISTVAGEPWIVGGDRYVLVASALDTAATSFPASAGFVPWLGRSVAERLAGAGGVASAASPGARVVVPPRVDSIELPDGRRAAVRDSIALPQRAGVYFWVRGNERAGAVAVNGEPEESELERLDDDAMARRVEGGTKVTHDAARAVSAAYGAAGRRPLGAVLLGLALVTLLAEALVAGRLSALLPRRPARTSA